MKEQELTQWCLQRALELGAQAGRVRLYCTRNSYIEIRDGEIKRCGQENSSVISMVLYKNQREIQIQTDKLHCKRELTKTLRNALEMSNVLEENREAGMAPKERKFQGDNDDIGCLDPHIFKFNESHLLAWAQKECRYDVLKERAAKEEVQLISESVSASYSYNASYLCDSDGFHHKREYSDWAIDSEVTIKDKEQNIYNQREYDYTVKYAKLAPAGSCSEKAFEKCLKRRGAKKCEGFCGTMVVAHHCISRLIAPLIDSLRAESIHYDRSFLANKQNEKVFSEHLTLLDRPHIIGHHSCFFYDYEGIATQDRTLIEKGVIRNYICSTEMSKKTGLPATISEVGRVYMEPFCKDLQSDKKEITLQDILSKIKDGIYVSGFNGGNCNNLSGDFSYGIEGFRIRNGKLEEPISEMLITGNMIQLFTQLYAVGSDTLEKTSHAIGSTAFENVTFNA